MSNTTESAETPDVGTNRRTHPRYPSWLPADLILPSGARVPVRVVDLSQGGACVEGLVRAPIGANIELEVDWASLSLAVDATIVAIDNAPVIPLTRLQFTNLDSHDKVVLGALVGAMAADLEDGQQILVKRSNFARHVIRSFHPSPGDEDQR
jgi:hypothetical protein